MSRVISDSQMRCSEMFRKRLNAQIAGQDCSIYEFAERANVSKGVVVRAAIYGIVPSLRPLIKIADTLHISLEYLLGSVERGFFEPAIVQSCFHERIKALCAERGLKFSQLAKFMPFSANLFYDWQREGTLPSLDYLIAIAAYFNVCIDYLLGRTDDRHL